MMYAYVRDIYDVYVHNTIVIVIMINYVGVVSSHMWLYIYYLPHTPKQQQQQLVPRTHFQYLSIEDSELYLSIGAKDRSLSMIICCRHFLAHFSDTSYINHVAILPPCSNTCVYF